MKYGEIIELEGNNGISAIPESVRRHMRNKHTKVVQIVHQWLIYYLERQHSNNVHGGA